MPERISGGAKVLALIADPVAHPPGPVDGLLQQRQQFGSFVLLPMQVSHGALADVLAGLRQIRDFAGAIVAMPYRAAIVPLLDELTLQARLLGAAGIVRKNDDGRLAGSILEGEGFVGGLKDAGYAVAGSACLLAGAGGAAAAIAFALAAHGCASLRIVNRTLSKAQSLVQRIRQAFPQVDVCTGAAKDARFDFAINATSLGMNESDPLPLPEALLARCAVVADCVIAPQMTPLLQTAAGHGCAVHSGLPMLAAQLSLMRRFLRSE